MKAPQRVVWTEGLFLTPQHFQQQDAYHEQLLALRLGAVTSLTWGLLSLEVDDAALASGQFQLNRVAGVLADGLPLVFERGEGQGIAARPIEPHFPATRKTLE